MQRPFITLTWAQSLNGTIARQRGQPTPISGPQSLVMTHQMRADHDAILVGIGTVLADDPALTVRHAPGDNPQPVVLDSQLNCPPTARLARRGAWIVGVTGSQPARERALTAAGADVLSVPPNADGRVSLPHMLSQLHQRGIRRLMVEGGGLVIAAFLAEKLADRLVITIAPRLLAGYAPPLHSDIALTNVTVAHVGDDIVLSGAPA